MNIKPYIIMTDTTSDLPESYIREHGIRVLSLGYLMEGKNYDREHPMDIREFYSMMRKGCLPVTSQVNPASAKEEIASCFKEGLDVLYIGFSSALSGTFDSVRGVISELKESGEFKDRKAIAVDSLCASLGEGLLVHKAVKMKEDGKTLEETAEWAQTNRLHVCHNFTVDDLFHLHRGGRLSKSAAIMGTLINIKPVLHVDDSGRLVALGRERGRKKSLRALVDRMERQAAEFENPEVFISHGDCLEDALYVRNMVRERLGVEKFLINSVGPAIGAHSGPGTVALFFMGDPR